MIPYGCLPSAYLGKFSGWNMRRASQWKNEITSNTFCLEYKQLWLLSFLTCTLESFLLMQTESPDRSDQRWSSSFAEISQSLKSLTASRYCSCSDTMFCMDCTLPFGEKKTMKTLSVMNESASWIQTLFSCPVFLY